MVAQSVRFSNCFASIRALAWRQQRPFLAKPRRASANSQQSIRRAIGSPSPRSTVAWPPIGHRLASNCVGRGLQCCTIEWALGCAKETQRECCQLRARRGGGAVARVVALASFSVDAQTQTEGLVLRGEISLGLSCVRVACVHRADPPTPPHPAVAVCPLAHDVMPPGERRGTHSCCVACLEMQHSARGRRMGRWEREVWAGRGSWCLSSAQATRHL